MFILTLLEKEDINTLPSDTVHLEKAYDYDGLLPIQSEMVEVITSMEQKVFKSERRLNEYFEEELGLDRDIASSSGYSVKAAVHYILLDLS